MRIIPPSYADEELRTRTLPINDALETLVGAIIPTTNPTSTAIYKVLIALKAWASAQTSSMAMLGSLADSSLDLIASIVVLLGVRVAAQPALERRARLDRLADLGEDSRAVVHREPHVVRGDEVAADVQLLSRMSNSAMLVGRMAGATARRTPPSPALRLRAGAATR